ncbi:MAG: DUF4230 domain-containing protein [Spirochaetota bacterium]
MSTRKKRTTRKPIRLIPLWLRLTILGLTAAALMITASITLFPMLGLSLKIPFSSRSQISESEILLKEIHPLFKLTTVEYTYKTVFPYDFIPQNSDPQRAYTRRQRGEELTTREQEAARLYEICRAAGIPLWNRSTDFVVLTSRVKGGYNLQPLLSSPSSDNELRVYPNSALKTIEIRLPAPVITELIIQDETSEFYQYPDIKVDAEQWRRITDYVEEQIRDRVIEEGILLKSEERIKALLSRLLQSSGWEEIVFTTASGSLQ